MGRHWKNFEVHWRKSFDCLEGNVGRNMDVKGDSVEYQKEEESCGETLHLVREYISNPEQNFGRNVDPEDHSDEVSKRNENRFFENRREGDPLNKVLKNLAEPHSSVLGKAEFRRNEINS